MHENMQYANDIGGGLGVREEEEKEAGNSSSRGGVPKRGRDFGGRIREREDR